MFTGIIEEIGIIKDIEKRRNLFIIKIRARKILKGLKKGDSVAIDGVCLTVTQIQKGILRFDIMKESLRCTTLGSLRNQDKINLERALKASDRISGHFVTGHIDEASTIKNIIKGANYTEFQFPLSKGLKPFLVAKGSICIDGVSLTIGKVKADHFSVHLIPHTKKVTTLGFKRKGDKINIETDILAKYILNNKKKR